MHHHRGIANGRAVHDNAGVLCHRRIRSAQRWDQWCCASATPASSRHPYDTTQDAASQAVVATCGISSTTLYPHAPARVPPRAIVPSYPGVGHAIRRSVPKRTSTSLSPMQLRHARARSPLEQVSEPIHRKETVPSASADKENQKRRVVMAHS